MTYRLNTFVEIIENRRHRSDYDYQPADWQVVGTAWIQVIPKRADERIQGQQVKDVTTHRLIARVNDKLVPGNRLRGNAAMFDIHGVIDIENRHEFVEMPATEITNG